jgi:hypothetical protein
MKALQIVANVTKESHPQMKLTNLLYKNQMDILVEGYCKLNPIDYKMCEGKLKDMISLKLPITIGF